jgi:hypothetical protein
MTTTPLLRSAAPPPSWAPSMRWTWTASSPTSPTTCASVGNGAPVTGERRVPETAVTHLVTDYHLYVDLAPVYA